MFKNLWRWLHDLWANEYERELKRQLKKQTEEIEHLSATRMRIVEFVRVECDRSYREGFLAGRASMGGQR